MPILKVRGLHSADTASQYSSDETGTVDDTFLFPKWWDKKANNVEYIRVFKLHMTRACDDIDIIIPASSDVEIRGVYDGNVTFRFDYHRGVRRMALTKHNSTTVDAEYIFPTRPSQAPTYKEYGAGPVVCFSSNPLGSWETFMVEHSPRLDLGGYEPADGFYDINEEPLNAFNLGLLGPLFDTQGSQEARKQARLAYLDCYWGCDSNYCNEQCLIRYKQAMEEIYDEFS